MKIFVICVKIFWFNVDVLQLKCFCCKVEWKVFKSGFFFDWFVYWKICNRYFVFFKFIRIFYYMDLIDQCVGDFRKLFKLVIFFCKDFSDSDLLLYDDLFVFMNKFGEFFVKKIEFIKDFISNI